MDTKERIASINSLNNEIINFNKNLFDIAEKRIKTIYLVIVGSILYMFSIIGTIFILLGILLRYLVYMNIYEITKSQQRLNAEIVKDFLE